jgi:2-iminobutanoate/2-iminopropanoate deaminase
MVEGGIVQETERVLDNLSAILKEAGLSFDHVVKTTIYLVDLGDFQAVNEVYGKRFTRSLPARATVQVAALPRGAHVEIDAIAATPVLP